MVDVETLGLDDPECGNPDAEWLFHWSQLVDSAPPSIQVPPRACSITTPLNFAAWRQLLMAHPNRGLVHFFLQGIACGFRIGYSLPPFELKSAKRNMNSARTHAKIVDDYLAEEVQAGRVMGSFPSNAIPNAQVSHFGVIPKAHQRNKWRLIIDLSHPKGKV